MTVGAGSYPGSSVKGRLQQVPRWYWALAGVLGVAVYLLGVGGVTSGIAAVVVVAGILAPILGTVLRVWNPFEPRPKPHLTVRPVDGEETASINVGAESRAVDVEAVVEDARQRYLSATPSSTTLRMGKYATPTEADHEKYRADVETYAEDVRAWAQDADEWLRERASVVEAEVIQHNPASVDADDADIFVFFPPGSEQFEDDTDPPEAPETPKFPLALTPAGRMLMGQSVFGPSDRGRRGTWDSSSYFPLGNEHVAERLVALEQDLLWRKPHFDLERDGSLKLSYRPQTIRHRQDVISGDPFRVRLPAGEHRVRWEVHARNLPNHVEGTWRFSCSAEPAGEPINNAYDLEAALRGEPVRDFDWAALFGREDEGADGTESSTP